MMLFHPGTSLLASIQKQRNCLLHESNSLNFITSKICCTTELSKDVQSVGERDYSAQEICHLLLQLPMYNASKDFIVLSLDGSRSVAYHFGGR